MLDAHFVTMNMSNTVSHFLFIGFLIMTLLAGYSDYLTGPHISMMLLYSIPVLAAARFCGKVEGIIVSASAAVTWFIVNSLGQHESTSDMIMSWNALTRFGIFALLAYAVSLQMALRESLEREKLRARTDQLTGLLNKWAFREQVEEEMERAKRYNHPISLVFIDLNNFKEINDLHGHARGDKLLEAMSATIQEAIRKTDLAGRVGGDEFTICFPETGSEQVRTAIGNLIRSLDIFTSQSGWQVTASIGVVTYVEVCDTYDMMIAQADKLMYSAKTQGGNNAEYLVLGNAKT